MYGALSMLPEVAVEAGYLDMLAEADKVEAKALAVAGQLSQLPGKAYAWNKKSIRKGDARPDQGELGGAS